MLFIIIHSLFTVGEEVFNCSVIDYFNPEGYSRDPLDSTQAIPCQLSFALRISSEVLPLYFSGQCIFKYNYWEKHKFSVKNALLIL